MGDPMSIEELKAEQARLGLGNVHLVHVGPAGFTIAHTNAERATGEPLVDCELHRWLHGLGGPPVEPGVWVAVPHVPDALQEPYGSDPWDFEDAEPIT